MLNYSFKYKNIVYYFVSIVLIHLTYSQNLNQYLDV